MGWKAILVILSSLLFLILSLLLLLLLLFITIMKKICMWEREGACGVQVVGHTIQEQGINSACAERVFRIDVGMSKGCGNGEPEVHRPIFCAASGAKWGTRMINVLSVHMPCHVVMCF